MSKTLGIDAPFGECAEKPITNDIVALAGESKSGQLDVDFGGNGVSKLDEIIHINTNSILVLIVYLYVIYSFTL